jgi:hypothetical protein
VRIAGASLVVVIATTFVAGDAWGWAEVDLERNCSTITLGHSRSLQELNRALALAGSRGKTRLDLGPPPYPMAAPGQTGPGPDGYRMLPPPKWTKPVDAARAIAAAKTMAGVKQLVLDGFPLSVEAARILAASPHVGALQSLSLAGAHLNGAVLHELLAPGTFPALVELNVTNNRFKTADLQELAARLAARKLQRLIIGARKEKTVSPFHETVWSEDPGKGVLPRDATAIEALARIAATPSLTALGFSDEPLGLPLLQALLGTGRKQPLEIATMGLAELSGKQLATLAGLDPEGRIAFSMSDLEIEAADLRDLDRSGLLARITTLQLHCGDACIRTLARSTHAGRLRQLLIGCEENVSFTKATALALARATGLPALREIAFLNEHEQCKESGIGNDGLRAVLKAPVAGQLESLTLVYQGLDDAGYVALARATALGALKELIILEDGSILTAATTKAFLRDGALASHLEVLRLQNEAAGWPVADLAQGLKMPKLRVLELPAATAPMRDWLRIARAPGWEHVQVLSIQPSVEGEQPEAKFFGELRKHLPADACLP